MNAETLKTAGDYWRTSIVDIHPGSIKFRGYPVQELIGAVSFPDMIWLLLQGDLPSAQQARLMEAALVASVDHGPHAPSIAVARMAVSCGLPLNGAMASAVNMLDDTHGGAGEQCAALYLDIHARVQAGTELAVATAAALDDFIAHSGKYIPGFGHRFHPIDPRTEKLLAMVDEAAAAGTVDGCFATIARSVESVLAARKGKIVPMNIDGATAVIYTELGFPPPLSRGIFCLARSVGILAHAWEQTSRHERNKGPMPRQFPYRYTGPEERHLASKP